MQPNPSLETPAAPLVEMQGISKSFGPNRVLDSVSLTLAPGSVHALMGENGAGKSTLMKILAGVHHHDDGAIKLAGRSVQIQSPKQAQELGVSTVFQELSLLPNLTIAENMFLGREPVARFGMLDRKRMHQETKAALAELDLELSPSVLVSELSIAERQFVEIAHGIKAKADVFILDEPTAALNAADVEVLNRQIARLKAAGKAVVYISHRMDEIFNVCDTVTVLKDGRHVASEALEGITESDLIGLMVGRDIKDLFPQRGANFEDVLLSVQDLKLQADSPPVSFQLKTGEIVGLAGLEGQGQQDIVRSLVGVFKPDSGHVLVSGGARELPMPAREGIRDMQKLGLAFVPEDRKEEGLYLGLSVAHNVGISLHSQRPGFAWAKRYKQQVTDAVTSMNVKASSKDTSVGTLSGGNQQKVLLGRYLAAGMKVLLIEEPTRGVDIGAKSEIYTLLRQFADKGGAVLVLSRETIELIGMSDRILVCHDQAIIAEMQAAEATEHAILDAALRTTSETNERAAVA